MSRILLSNSIGPFDLGWGEDMRDLFSARLTRGQGAFGMQAHLSAYGLHVIAENIPGQVTVLEEPTEELLIEELKKGYDYVGLQIKPLHIPKLAGMMRLCKQISPETKIVIGGYGVMVLREGIPNDPQNNAQYILETADYISEGYEDGEGVRFFRKLLGAPPDAPITQNHTPLFEASIAALGNLIKIKNVTILVGLGCPNACEFCVTSAHFQARKVQVATPEEVVQYLEKGVKRIGNSMNLFTVIWDEDFLLDKPFVTRLSELIMEKNLTKAANFFCFASIKSISQYTAEELALAGIRFIWIGVESKFEEVMTGPDSITKRKGRDVLKVFRELQKYGVGIIASTILGWDFHNRKNILEDIDYFVSLRPVFYQISPLTPCPGTKLYGRMQEENRISETFGWKDSHLWKDDPFVLRNFERNEIKKYFDLAHKKLFETNGPSFLSFLDVCLQGYRTMLHHKNRHMQMKAENLWFLSSIVLRTLLEGVRAFAPSKEVVDRCDELEARCTQYFGEMGFKQAVFSRLAALGFRAYQGKRNRPDYSVSTEAACKITRYSEDKSRPPWVIVKDGRSRSSNNILPEALSFFLAPYRDRGFPIKLEDIDEFDADFKTMEIEGNIINYVDEGKREALLMLHGNPTWSYLYRHIIRDLKGDYRCIAPDFLGFGLSDKPPKANYALQAHINRLERFIKKLRLKNITLVGHEWGGTIGLGYACQNKDRFRRLILMSTTGFPPLRGNGKVAAYSSLFPFLRLLRVPKLGRKLGVGALSFSNPRARKILKLDLHLYLREFLIMGTENRRPMDKRVRDGYFYPFQVPNSREGILSFAKQIPVPGLPGVTRQVLGKIEAGLKGWDIPTQVIWGDRDRFFDKWYIEKFKKVLPNHQEPVIIPRAGHLLPEERPDAVIRAIREFLKKGKRLKQNQPRRHPA